MSKSQEQNTSYYESSKENSNNIEYDEVEPPAFEIIVKSRNPNIEDNERNLSKTEGLERTFSRHESEFLVHASELLIRLEHHHSGIKVLTEDELTQNYKTDVHTLSLEELELVYQTSLKSGLDSNEFERIFEIYGPNKLSKKREIPWYILLLMKLFHGLFNIVLWIGAIASFIAYGIHTENNSVSLFIGIVLVIVVTITGLFVYYQEGASAKFLSGFTTLSESKGEVYRNNEIIEIPFENLVPGDMIKLNAGDKIPADVRIIECSKDTKVDNSVITGETEPQALSAKCTDINPAETKNIAFYGTLLVQGGARAMVFNTADSTMMGRIAKLASAEKRKKSTIAKEIDVFVQKIAILSLLSGVILFVLLYTSKFPLVDNFVLCIGVIVANVPEGLIATVAVSLGLTAKKMAQQNVNVKNLESIATLGSTSVIASDKTGTLTQNRMTVSHVFYDLQIFKCDTDKPPKGEYDSNSLTYLRLIRCATLCNSAIFISDGSISGDASETALTKFVNTQIGNGVMEYRSKHQKMHGIPFNSSNKWQISVHRLNTEEDANSFVVVLKGAADRCLEFCDSYYDKGNIISLTETVKEQISNEGVLKLSSKGERVLCFCELPLRRSEYADDFIFDGSDRDDVNYPFGRKGENGLVFIGLMSMTDPPRVGVREAVDDCHNAGIKVIMVTGDHPITAKSISEDINIIKGPTIDEIAKIRNVPAETIDPLDNAIKASIVTGSDLESELVKNDNQVKLFWDVVLGRDYCAFARTSPQQKLLIVRALQERGHCVSSTGDGVNDAPALKTANTGISMGISGTDVAKEASNMILLDDNFTSIVNGIRCGRLLFDNLKKSIAYALCSKTSQFAPYMIMAICAIPLPFSIILVITVDLVTDILPAISYAYEPEEENCMNRPPRDLKRDKLVTWPLMLWSYLQVGIIQFLAGMFSYVHVMYSFGLSIQILFSRTIPQELFIPVNRKEYAKMCCYTNNECTFVNLTTQCFQIHNGGT